MNQGPGEHPAPKTQEDALRYLIDGYRRGLKKYYILVRPIGGTIYHLKARSLEA